MVGVTTHRTHGRLRRRYGPHPDQFGELHVSRTDPERGSLVLVHGGFWRTRRDLAMTRPAAEALADLGWNVWNLEYRRGANISWRETLDDCAAGLDHLTGLADELQLDLSEVIVVGHSAGGQLAASLAAHAHRQRSRMVTGLVTLNGVMHLEMAAELEIGDGAVAGFIREDAAALDSADPARILPIGVPVRCLHGRDDERVPFVLAEEFCRLARSAGDNVDLQEIPGQHTAPIDPAGPTWPFVADALTTPWPSFLASSERSGR